MITYSFETLIFFGVFYDNYSQTITKPPNQIVRNERLAHSRLLSRESSLLIHWEWRGDSFHMRSSFVFSLFFCETLGRQNRFERERERGELSCCSLWPLFAASSFNSISKKPPLHHCHCPCSGGGGKRAHGAGVIGCSRV